MQYLVLDHPIQIIIQKGIIEMHIVRHSLSVDHTRDNYNFFV